LNPQDKVGGIDFMGNPRFHLVAGGPRTLEALMPARARQRAPRTDEVAFASAQVAAPQRKLDELTDLDRINGSYGCNGHSARQAIVPA
jgi:hypothetical protein